MLVGCGYDACYLCTLFFLDGRWFIGVGFPCISIDESVSTRFYLANFSCQRTWQKENFFRNVPAVFPPRFRGVIFNYDGLLWLIV